MAHHGAPGVLDGEMEAMSATEEVREECRRVADYIATMAEQGATKDDIARNLPNIRAADINARIQRCSVFGLISTMAGEVRQGMQVYHITMRGNAALGRGGWHVDGGGQ
jgi:hypothetical protein